MKTTLAAALSVLLLAPQQATVQKPERVHFNRDIRPILSDNCLKCHGPDKAANKTDLRLDSREAALADLGGYFGIVPGKPAESEVWKRITTDDSSDRMPSAKSGKTLTKPQIELLRRWIEEGAEYQGHWAFIPPQPVQPPSVRNAGWARSPIDRFILSRLEKEGLRPSAEAERITLLRRLSFDLTGLPPSVDEVDAFLADRDPAAYEKQVDRLLASPHFGERMAVHWLDLVRYADSRGYHSDNPRRVAPYRDYVIRAFNENLRFDRFTIEQLAGDLLPEPTLWQRVASGYNKLNQTTEEGGAQAREYEAKTVADRVRNVSGVWLGATMGCCECHDHKFDPYSTRDFYAMGAFFADIQEGSIADRDPGIYVPDEAEEAEIARMDSKIADLRKKLDTPTLELDQAQAAWEKKALEPFPWIQLVPESLKSAGGASFLVEEDASVRVGGANPAKDTHTVVLKEALRGVRAIRLEAIADPLYVGRSPGGNFALTRFRVQVAGKDVAIGRATADFSQENWPVSNALVAKGNTGWAVLPHVGKDHEAVFELARPLDLGPGATVLLEYQSPHAAHVIGRFRLTVTTRDPAEATPLPDAVRAILRAPAGTRTPEQKKQLADFHRSVSPLLGPARAALQLAEKEKTEFLKGVRQSLVSRPGPPRTVRVLPRGNWLDASGEVVTPAIPAFLGKLEAGEKRATRLDLANWILSEENPLAARTFVNRLWKLYFGTGLSKVLDDLGGQGEWPVHPELLDWLALDFRKDWDMKRAVRQLVTSAAYRQSSKATREARERDPQNRLVARQGRWRLDAEFVRDNALAVSGLLVRKIGGESVKPHQPAGYWYHLNFPKREWQNDKGENAYRRGLYTWWQRTFHHPSMMAFDAPSREEATMERSRSNIPQQALALLNDPTYVEAARVFAERIVREAKGTTEERAAWAFRQAVSRPPVADEAKVLAALYADHLASFKADAKAAGELTKVGQAPQPEDALQAEVAAWTSVARAILNLHETITRH